MPRKTKLTPQVQEAIVQALTLGAVHAHACAYAGIDHATFYRWLQKGEAGLAPYREFYEGVKRAEARSVVGWLAKIEAAANAGHWQAAAWKLERRYPHVWGRRQVITHTGEDGPVEYVLKVIYESEAAARARLTTRLEHLGQRYGEEGAEA
jgi:hypothetical protein